jgi:hypothetical protein
MWKYNLVAFTARGFVLMFKFKGLHRERERARDGEGVLRDTIFKGGKKNIFFPSVLKVPRQCSVVLLVEVTLRCLLNSCIFKNSIPTTQRTMRFHYKNQSVNAF